MCYSWKTQTGGWGFPIPSGIEKIARRISRVKLKQTGISRGDQESGVSRSLGFNP